MTDSTGTTLLILELRRLNKNIEWLRKELTEVRMLRENDDLEDE